MGLRRLKDRLASGLFVLATALTLAPLALVLYEVVRRGLPVWSASFFTEIPAAVGQPGGGVANAIVGTFILVAVAVALGVPIGVLSGIYLSEFAGSPGNGGPAAEGRLARVVRVTSDVLTGVPTVVVGIFVYAVLVVRMHGFSAFAGSVALAVILLPTIVRVSEDMLRLVPRELRDAGLALGVAEWRVILTVALRAAAPGILTGVGLGVARIAGETAPLLFTAFGNPNWEWNPLRPVAALPLDIFLYAISPYENLHEMAWGVALLLIVLVIAANALTRRLVRGRKGVQA